MNRRPILGLVALTAFSLQSGAQFYDADVDPGGIRWSVRRSGAYSLYYPSQTDSLATLYLRSLESVRPMVGASIGVMPNEAYRRPMTALLHPYTPTANGSVSWAPRRLDLYSVQEAVGPDPYPWIEQLTIHESRHIAQMQLGRRGKYKPAYWIVGQMLPGVMPIMYGGSVFLEGDAVTAETGLTQSGRGRTADFLEYMRVAFDEGDFRDWYSWRYGSLNRYSPDYYKLGYVTVAGTRTLYDDPLFSERFYHNISHSWWPLPWNILHKTMKQASGKKFKASFREIENHFRDDWAADIEARGPYMPSEIFTPATKYYETVSSPVFAGNRLFALRSGIARVKELVELSEDGSQRHVLYMSGNIGALRWSEENGRIYWSEDVPDPRWGLGGTARIAWYEPASGDHGFLTREGRLFNPSPLGGGMIATVDYPVEGGSLIRILDPSGETVNEIPAPDGLQVTEVAQMGGALVAAGITERGMSLYRVSDWTALLVPRFVKIKQLQSYAGGILFVSDRTGVNEIYHFCDGTVKQLSCTRHGASDAAILDGKMYWAAPGVRDKGLVRTAFADLPARTVDFGDVHRYAIADELSAQEAALTPKTKVDTTIGESRRYRRLLNPLSIHSWAPLFVDYESYSGIGEVDLEEQVGVGATAFFQNRIGSLAGSAGLKFTSSENDDKLRTSMHVDAVYSGLYPVLELDLSVNERDAYTYRCFCINDEFQVYGFHMDGPAVNASINAYIPFNFKRGGWYRGVVPRMELYLSNDIFNSDVIHMSQRSGADGFPSLGNEGSESGKTVYYKSTLFSLKAYSTLATPQSCIYPKWGAGAEIGYSLRNGLDNIYSKGFYARMYGYLPGAMETHGIKLSNLLQVINSSDMYAPRGVVNCIPRGITGSSVINYWMAANYRVQDMLSIDYAMPVLPVDMHIGQLAYIRNFEIRPFADFTIAEGEGQSGRAYSIGASLGAHLCNLAWITRDIKTGIRVSWSGGNIYDELHAAGLMDRPLSVGTYMTINL